MKRNYEPAIQEALASMPDVYLNEVQNQHVGGVVAAYGLKDLPDNHPFTVNMGPLYRPGPGEIFVRDQDAADYKEVLTRATELAGCSNLSHIGEDVEHELEHLKAFQTLQAGQAVLGVSLVNLHESRENPNSRVGYQAFNRGLVVSTTKLGHAAMLAFPREPSRTDLRLLEQMGMSVEEVGFKAQANNRSGQGKLIPVPRSYVPSTKTYISLQSPERGLTRTPDPTTPAQAKDAPAQSREPGDKGPSQQPPAREPFANEFGSHAAASGQPGASAGPERPSLERTPMDALVHSLGDAAFSSTTITPPVSEKGDGLSRSVGETGTQQQPRGVEIRGYEPGRAIDPANLPPVPAVTPPAREASATGSTEAKGKAVPELEHEAPGLELGGINSQTADQGQQPNAPVRAPEAAGGHNPAPPARETGTGLFRGLGNLLPGAKKRQQTKENTARLQEIGQSGRQSHEAREQDVQALALELNIGSQEASQVLDARRRDEHLQAVKAQEARNKEERGRAPEPPVIEIADTQDTRARDVTEERGIAPRSVADQAQQPRARTQDTRGKEAPAREQSSSLTQIPPSLAKVLGMNLSPEKGGVAREAGDTAPGTPTPQNRDKVPPAREAGEIPYRDLPHDSPERRTRLEAHLREIGVPEREISVRMGMEIGQATPASEATRTKPDDAKRLHQAREQEGLGRNPRILGD